MVGKRINGRLPSQIASRERDGLARRSSTPGVKPNLQAPQRRGRKPNMKAYFAANMAARGSMATKDRELSKLIPQALKYVEAAERTRDRDEKVRLLNGALGLKCLDMEERAEIARKIERLGGKVL